MTVSTRALAPMFAGMALGLLVAELDQAAVSTALPTILGDLGGGQRVQWINTAFVATATLAMPAYGVLGDRFGRRPLLLLALGLLVSGSVICGSAGTVDTLVAGRAVQGLGAGGMLIMVQAAVADVIPARERQAWMSVIGVVFAVAAVGGPVLGGWLADGVGWRWIFWMDVPLGAVSMVSVAVLLPRRSKAGRPERMPGSRGSRPGVVPEMIALLARPAVALPLMTGAVLGLTVFGVVGYLPTYIEMSFALTPTDAGLLMLTLAAGIGIASVVSAQLVRRTGRYRAHPVLGCAVAALGLILLAGAGQAASLRWTGVALVLLGVGIGYAWEVLVVMVQNASPAGRVGAVTAANGFVRELGVSAGVALAGLLLASRLSDQFARRLATADADLSRLTPLRLAAAPAGVRASVASVYRDAFFPVLLAGVPLLLLMAGLMLLVPAHPLARTTDSPARERTRAEMQSR